VEQVNKAKCFTVLADETADISGVEQFSLCVRFVDISEKVIREDFLQFVPVHDVSGRGLASTLLQSLVRFGIDTTYMRGQGYDGAAAMKGEFNGVQACVQESHPKALYMHCASHSLNLAISSASNTKDIRNCTGTMEAVYNFFNYPKRQHELQKAIEETECETKRSRLKKNVPYALG
jgi:hypothetical protein